jgi:hypothetical protein
MPPRRTISIVRKKLGREKADGMTMGDGKVYIDPRQSGADELDTVLHELMHHVCPDMSEEAVAEKSATMSGKGDTPRAVNGDPLSPQLGRNFYDET